MRTIRLRVTLREVVPQVLRVIDVPATCTLPELHDLLQAALGWTQSHLHLFIAGDQRYSVADEDNMLDARDQFGVRLRDLPDRLTYLYDFGDGWEHDVEVLGPGAETPGCRYGEGACPPEDCGGPGGYAELLDVLADPAHPGHQRMRRWAGELADFDPDATDLLVRRAVGEVPPSVRLVLDLAADGVKLTPGGRFPRAFVRLVQQQRPQWHPLDRPASIEEDLMPLAALHGVLRHVRLLRLSKGVVRPTRAAADDLEVVRRLRGWFEPSEFATRLTELTIALLAAAGPLRDDALAIRALPMLGPGWSKGEHPLTLEDVRLSISGLAAELIGLDLVAVDWPVWSAGPAARSLLPRATLLADLLDERLDHAER